MNRREALHALTVAGAGVATLPLWLVSLIARARTHAETLRQAADLAAGSAVFTTEQHETVDVLTELIIPETDTAGASRSRVTAFIDTVLDDAEPSELDNFLNGLAWLDERAHALFGAAFKDATPEQQHALQVERFIGVSGQAEGLPQLPDGAFLPPMNLTCGEETFVESAKVCNCVEDRSRAPLKARGSEFLGEIFARARGVTAEPRNYREFTLSPDGVRVAARVGEGDGQADIWIYDMDRDTSKCLTFEPGTELSPTWRPDGVRVAFGRSDSPLSWKAADGTGEVEPLGESPMQFPQAFSPDGNLVVFEDWNTGIDLGMLSLENGGTTTMLTQTTFAEQNPSLSPDGRWLAYQSNESGQWEVYVRPFPYVNSGRWQVSSGEGNWPVWNPAADELFYVGPQGVMALAFSTEPTFTPETATQLFDMAPYMPPTADRTRRMAVAPDGQRFLLLKPVAPVGAEDAEPAQVVLVQNWFEEPSLRLPRT